MDSNILEIHKFVKNKYQYDTAEILEKYRNFNNITGDKTFVNMLL